MYDNDARYTRDAAATCAALIAYATALLSFGVDRPEDRLELIACDGLDTGFGRAVVGGAAAWYGGGGARGLGVIETTAAAGLGWRGAGRFAFCMIGLSIRSFSTCSGVLS